MTLHVSYIIDAASIMNELCRFLQSFKCFFCSYCFIQHYPQVSKSLIFHVLLIIDLEIKLKTSLSFVHFHWFRCFTGNTCIYCLFVSPSVLLLSGLYPDFIISYYLFCYSLSKEIHFNSCHNSNVTKWSVWFGMCCPDLILGGGGRDPDRTASQPCSV